MIQNSFNGDRNEYHFHFTIINDNSPIEQAKPIEKASGQGLKKVLGWLSPLIDFIKKHWPLILLIIGGP
ncbi:hypothetical protein [Flaviaesturariibacter terrae]